jgi:hypothetical protein
VRQAVARDPVERAEHKLGGRVNARIEVFRKVLEHAPLVVQM